MRLTKHKIIQLSDWTYGGQFRLTPPIFGREIDFELYLGAPQNIEQEHIETLNQFLNLKPSDKTAINNLLMQAYQSITTTTSNHASLLDLILASQNITPESFALKRDEVAVELVWPDCRKTRGRYVNIAFYPEEYAQGIFVVIENGVVKTYYVCTGLEKDLPKGIYQ